ncbi:hypothetical protein BD779DRAFT_334167 [Infundibulicybe gibba]|nr:hypothetical protein BD779DRAFT_334167 [Infundibulicybe gibba]
MCMYTYKPVDGESSFHFHSFVLSLRQRGWSCSEDSIPPTPINPMFSSFPIPRTNSDDEKRNPTLVYIFISLHLVGLFGNLLMILTVVFSRSLTRSPTWLNFTFSWIISAFSYTLLFIAGQLSSPQPPFGICLTQAMMIYAAPPLAATATFALVLDVWLKVRISAGLGKTKSDYAWLTLLFLILPYIFYASLAIACLVLGTRDPQIVQKVGSGMYCNLSNTVPGRISAILVTVFLVPTLGLIILILSSLRNNWRTFRQEKHGLPLIIRVLIFTFFGVVAIVLIFFSTIQHGAALNIVISTLPVIVFMIFASQTDILDAWMCWRPRPTRYEKMASGDANP